MWDQLSLFVQPDRPYTVSEVTSRISALIQQEPVLQDLWIEGEVSNFSRASSGHIYLTIKDTGAQLSGVIWRSQARDMTYLPRSGDQVVVHGRVSVYAQSGRYQIYIDRMRPAGRGSLYEEFERLKAQLEAEGLFSVELKKPLPQFPSVIGVVTSPNAAAFRDVLHVLERRYPLARVILSPTLVQGEAAPANIVRAIAALNARDDIDVILLVRGGGSLEDLWAFNDEVVTRSVANSRLPIIAGIGHETDFSLADFAADQRAPTPSAAAEIATPDFTELYAQIQVLVDRLQRDVYQRFSIYRERVGARVGALHRLSPLVRIGNYRQRIDELTNRLDTQVVYGVKYERQRLASVVGRMHALDPEAVLSRGYTIIRKHNSDQLVVSSAKVQPDQVLDIIFHDGEVVVTVTSST
ncbi:MAG: exodeoxyribonuclease VII large subunit [Anaerolineae bacterium]|nr:exodeoxyribonuclease VII large subunit [Anaerolineae bacterium]